MDTNDTFIDPGERIVYRQSTGLTVANPDGRVKVVTNPSLVFDPLNAGKPLPLLLVRSSLSSEWTTTSGMTHDLAVDYVPEDNMKDLFLKQEGAPGRAYAIWRALPDPAVSADVAPWACTRNFFSAPFDTPYLGKFDKPLSLALSRSGMPIRVDNRGPVTDNTLPIVNTTGALKPGTDPLPQVMWRVHGWHELGRVLLVGNPSVNDLLNNSAKTITDSIKDACELWDDINKDDRVDAGEWADVINPGFFDRLFLNERQLRLDFTWLDMKLMDCISLVSPADDGIDNDNADGDSRLNYTTNPITDPGLYTGADDLLECRIPGRINVNTAPEAVLKALFPALWTYEMKWDNTANQYVPTGSYIPLTADELDMISGWYAKAIIYLRNKRTDRDAQNRGGPFVSLADLFDRLDKFDNPKLNADGERDPTGTAVIPELSAVLDAWVSGPAHPNCLRFGILVDAVKFERADRPRVYWDTHRSQLVGVTPVGYVEAGSGPMIGDFEERDWIFSRMANLLTVRSDSFTAYIAVRVQDIERRYVAILDRSNVFLPESAARNGSFWNSDTGPYTDDSGEMAIYDPDGKRYGPSALNDPDYFDRQYVTPRVVALRQVPDPR